jgi:L-threonylcarbamoyladenylate synthase
VHALTDRPGLRSFRLLLPAGFAADLAVGASVAVDGVCLTATAVHPGDGLIALAVHETPPGVIRLAAPKSVDDYARQLYAALRRADHLGLTRIVAMTPPGTGMAMAIRDRLIRASHSSSSEQ